MEGFLTVFLEFQLTVTGGFRLANQVVVVKRVNLKGSDRKTEVFFECDEIDSVKIIMKSNNKIQL